MFEARDATLGDVDPLLLDVRPEDRDEWIASGAGCTRDAVAASIVASHRPRTIHKDGRVLCIYGVTPTAEPNVGVAWLIGTKLGQHHARRLVRLFTEAEMALVSGDWETLVCWADSRNRSHHLWLNWMGFDWIGTVLAGPLELPFEYFERYRPCALPKS